MRALAAGIPARLRLVRSVRLPSLSPKLRRRLIAAIVIAGLLTSVYMLWLRDSSLVRVERVSVSGLTTDDAGRLRAALDAEGKTMTTLHVRHDRLQRVIEGFPAVRAIEVDADFPHAMHVHVIEWRPVAVAVAGGRRVAVGAEGGLLRGVPAGDSLPTVQLESLPPAQVGPGEPLRVISVLGGAPGALRPRLEKATVDGDKGIVVQMREGPELIFGDPRLLAAKWAAAARVLADPASKGAAYVDLRLPDRPVAGGLPAEQAAPSAIAESEAEQAPEAVPGATEAPPVAPVPAAPEAVPPAAEPPAAEQPQPAEPVTPESQP